jgi:addiction module HigA family antidote
MMAAYLPVGRAAAAKQPASISTTTVTGEAMLMTKRKPATVGEILVQEFMHPMGLSQGALAKAMGVQRKHVNELCNDRRTVTAPTALILARVFGNNPEFWLNRAAAHRSVGGDELTLRTRAN